MVERNGFELAVPISKLPDEQRLTLARKLGKPFPLCSAYSGVCTVYRDRGEVSALEQAANELRVLADEHGFGLWREMGTYWRAWCLVKKGSVEEGLNQVQRIMAARRAEVCVANY